MSDASWTKVFHDDLLHGCRAANMTGEEIGVYCTVLWLIASRGAPIEFDSRWIAGFAGVTPRKATAIITKLGAMPNKLVVRNGMIGNRKMLRTVAERDKKSDQARQAANARWHGDDQELPLDYQGDYRPDNPSDNREINGSIKTKKSRKTAKDDDADASSFTRARDSETQNNNHTNDKTLEVGDDEIGERSVGRGKGLGEAAEPQGRSLFDQVCDAAGYNPIQPGHIAQSYDIIRGWRDAGIDFEAVVLPTIRNIVANSNDPTSSLIRFDRHVRHQHAKAGAQPAGRAYKAPAAPITDQPGEEPCMAPLRADLLERLGPKTFARYVNPVLFESLDQGGQRILRVTDKRPPSMALMDGERSAIVRAVAKRHGFDTVW